ncbi:exonuclease SbcCD subunit D [Lacticaseibacillus daqingensis]|uniref:exonuclease SbcCD subunit D n=1 Tax=Lacticaseibacillus daqingensis TaxID=2486014 RepID=UPI000F76F72D|nr:exonuclease SbcCD subunit D [Lacticaseibacillus daqingensis]
MRLLHTADWHIGKKLAGFDLAADQAAIFAQLVATAKRERVDAIVIAGDLYDRALANEAAVTMVNDQLAQLNRTLKYPVLAIAGNHDSAVRLATGRDWYGATQLYLNTQLAEAFTPVVLGDTQFFLLPYFEPVAARQYFDDDSLTNINRAMHRVTQELQAQFDPTKKHVLIAHFFAANSHRSDSETQLAVGGLDAVDVADLAAFDYVALGHLHNRHALDHPTIQYAGSLLKYSVSEVAQEKGVFILDTDTMVRRFVALPPLHEVQHLTGSFADLTDPAHYAAVDREAYTAITLTDVAVIPNVMTALRQVFPRTISLQRASSLKLDAAAAAVDPKLGPMPMLADFYQQVQGTALSADQTRWAKAALAQAREGQ